MRDVSKRHVYDCAFDLTGVYTMRRLRIVSSARARKLRKLGEYVWRHELYKVLVWDMGSSKRCRNQTTI